MENILPFSTEITVYLGNGTRLAHGYHGSSIGRHRWHRDVSRCVGSDDVELP